VVRHEVVGGGATQQVGPKDPPSVRPKEAVWVCKRPKGSLGRADLLFGMTGIAAETKGHAVSHGVITDPVAFHLGPFDYPPRRRVEEPLADDEEGPAESSVGKHVEDARCWFWPRAVVERESEPRHRDQWTPVHGPPEGVSSSAAGNHTFASSDRTLICNKAAAISICNGSERMDISRFLIVLGLVILAAGVLWPMIGKLGLGRLPGDIVIERDGFSFYFPITTGLIVSAFISGILWLLGR
jgi:hypothetical protein